NVPDVTCPPADRSILRPSSTSPFPADTSLPPKVRTADPPFLFPAARCRDLSRADTCSGLHSDRTVWGSRTPKRQHRRIALAPPAPAKDGRHAALPWWGQSPAACHLASTRGTHSAWTRWR